MMNKRKKIITAAVALVITMCTCGAYPAAASDVIYSCQSSKKNIALTFDDGPHPVHTPEILDILAEYGIKATFFVIGENATWYGDLVKTEYESGHEIGNHTYSHHMNLKKLSTDGLLITLQQVFMLQVDMPNAVQMTFRTSLTEVMQNCLLR